MDNKLDEKSKIDHINTQDFILYEEKGRIASITINRPDKANSFNLSMLKVIYEKLIEANKNDKVRCIIIKSTGEKFFCAGYDLDEVTSNREIANQIITYGRKVNETIFRLKKPIITQVQGISIGFGVLMILASDLRVFADRPKDRLYLRLPEIAISIFPQTGATLLPLLAFGLNYAKNLLFTTDKIGVEELKNINFPTRIFPFETLNSDTFSFVKEISKYQEEFSYTLKSMLNIMNKSYINSCLNLEDEFAKIVYEKKMSVNELDDYINNYYDNFP